MLCGRIQDLTQTKLHVVQECTLTVTLSCEKAGTGFRARVIDSDNQGTYVSCPGLHLMGMNPSSVPTFQNADNILFDLFAAGLRFV